MSARAVIHTPWPRKLFKARKATLKTQRTRVKMGHTLLGAKWQKKFRRSMGNIREAIIIKLEKQYDPPRPISPWNSDYVRPGHLNSTFSSYMLRAYLKSQRLAAVLEKKGLNPKLYQKIPLESADTSLPPLFKSNRKVFKMEELASEPDKTEETDQKRFKEKLYIRVEVEAEVPPDETKVSSTETD